MSRANGSRSWSAVQPCTPRYLLIAFLLLSGWFTGISDAAAKTRNEESQRGSRSTGAKEVEPVIEEVNAKQLERALNEKDFVAVYWCKCETGMRGSKGRTQGSLRDERTTEWSDKGDHNSVVPFSLCPGRREISKKKRKNEMKRKKGGKPKIHS